MSNIEDFKKTIKFIAEEKKSTLIKNEGLEHACSLLSTIFDYSTKIKMFSGSLSETLTGRPEYLNSLKSFLKRCEKFELLLQRDINKEKRSKALNLIINSINENIKVKYLKDETVYKLLKEINNNKDVHFTLGNNNIYRYEHNTQEYRAMASFNDLKMNDILAKYFDQMFENNSYDVK